MYEFERIASEENLHRSMEGYLKARSQKACFGRYKIVLKPLELMTIKEAKLLCMV